MLVSQNITFGRLKQLIEEISEQGNDSPVRYFNMDMPEKSVWCKIAEKVQVHLCGKMSPDIAHQRPNESEKTRIFREKTYKPFTIVDTQKAVNAIKSALNRTPSNITMRSETKEYIEQPIFDGMDFYQYDKSVLSEKVIYSQNDLLVTYPDELVEDLSLKNPIQHIPHDERYEISQYDDVFIFISPESKYIPKFKTCSDNYEDYTEIEKEYSKIIYHIFTLNGIYRIARQDGGEWFIEELYIHNLGCTFVEIIKGKETAKNVHAPIIFPAMWGYGDNVLNQKSDATIVTINNAHARMIVQKTMCPTCKGSKKIIKGYDQVSTCDKCDSDGRVYLDDIGGVIFEKSQYSHTEQVAPPKDPIRFVKPESESVELQNKLVEQNADLYRRGLCLFQRREGSGRESAESIELQLQPQRELIATVGEHYHAIRERLLSYIQYYQLGSKLESVTVSRPTVYAIHTDSQALEMVIELMNSEADISVKEERIISYLTTYVGEQSKILKTVKILSKCDPLYFYTFNQKCKGLKDKTMLPNDVQFSIYLYGKSKSVLNEEMTEEEMIKAIDKLKNGKAIPPQENN